MGAAGIGAYFLFGKSASAATSDTTHPGNDLPKTSTAPPSGGLAPGRYLVSTAATGQAGQLAMRQTPIVAVNNVIEWLPHGSYVQAIGPMQTGPDGTFAQVTAPDAQTGWASLTYLMGPA